LTLPVKPHNGALIKQLVAVDAQHKTDTEAVEIHRSNKQLVAVDAQRRTDMEAVEIYRSVLPW
jgi:hypothetical protein